MTAFGPFGRVSHLLSLNDFFMGWDTDGGTPPGELAAAFSLRSPNDSPG